MTSANAIYLSLGPIYSKYRNSEIKHICREGKAANRLLQNKIVNKFVESIERKCKEQRKVCFSIHSFIRSFTCLSIYVPKYIFIYLFIYLFIHLFIYLFPYIKVTGMLVRKLKVNP